MAYPFKTFIPATERPGIRDSIAEIVNRHMTGEIATAIVAPPRYGKSDIIRLSALELVQMGYAAAAIALVPWDNLADQLVDKEKTMAMVSRYMYERLPNSPDVFRAGRIRSVSDNFHETSELQHLFTATIQLIDNQILFFEKWIDRCMSYGERPIVFIDEGQLLSYGNEWGKIAKVVEDKGAHMVLLTGTPYRADCKPIPGFHVRTISSEDIEKTVSRRVDDEHVLHSLYSGVKQERILVANKEIKLREAWDDKALCQVDAQWINATLEINGDQVRLDSLNGSQTQKHLRDVVTNPKVIKEAMEKAVLDMKERRKAGMKDSGILVVTTSDIETGEHDGLANWHARRVRDQVKIIDSSLDISIATQAVDDDSRKGRAGANALKRFSHDGIGDVLIVKNMGTVGLDCERLKTIVLLGTTRQLATWVQTILRGGTTSGDIEYFTLILTDDIKNKENWEFIVHSQGGSFTATDLVKDSEELVEKEIEPDEHDELNVVKAEYTRSEDSKNTDVVSDDLVVHQAIARFPILRERMSQVEIAALIKSGALNIDELSDDSPVVGVADTGSECSEHRARAVDFAKQYANKNASYGTDRYQWVEKNKEIMKKAKKIAGISGEIGKVSDPVKLKMLADYLERVV